MPLQVLVRGLEWCDNPNLPGSGAVPFDESEEHLILYQTQRTRRGVHHVRLATPLCVACHVAHNLLSQISGRFYPVHNF